MSLYRFILTFDVPQGVPVKTDAWRRDAEILEQRHGLQLIGSEYGPARPPKKPRNEAEQPAEGSVVDKGEALTNVYFSGAEKDAHMRDLPVSAVFEIRIPGHASKRFTSLAAVADDVSRRFPTHRIAVVWNIDGDGDPWLWFKCWAGIVSADGEELGRVVNMSPHVPAVGAAIDAETLSTRARRRLRSHANFATAAAQIPPGPDKNKVVAALMLEVFGKGVGRKSSNRGQAPQKQTP